MIALAALRQRVRARLGEQRELVTLLLAQREQFQGSLFTRFAECRKAGCACQRGERHGPYFILSGRVGGQGLFAYLRESDLEVARDLLRRSREFRRGMRRLQRTNAALLELLRQYQKAGTAAGGRRFLRRATKSEKASI
jgi:hypothetical protein